MALIHALDNPTHDSGYKIESCVEYLFGNSRFPGVRQAAVHSRLAIADDGDRKPDKRFFPVRK